MKLDKHLPRLKLSETQSYFAECWFNMVHQHSLDSYRVRVMNPLNILKELKRVYELGTPDERRAVRKEALEILNGDLVLKQPEFADSANQVVVVMQDGGSLAKSKEEGSARNLLFYFIAELQELVERDYVKTSFRYLKENLLDSQDFKGNDALRDERFSQIYTVTSHLLSVLIDQKASIESLFNLYSQVLIPREVRQNYQFQREYDRLCAIITESPDSLELLAEKLNEMGNWYIEYADSISESLLNEKVHFSFVDGGSGAMTRGDILIHVCNHKAFHRGHIGDMFYQSGYRPPSIDLPVYIRDAFNEAELR